MVYNRSMNKREKLEEVASIILICLVMILFFFA
jgi:hypothetical protein